MIVRLRHVNIVFSNQTSTEFPSFLVHIWQLSMNNLTYPWISGRMYSALYAILKSNPGNKLTDVLFLNWEIPSPPKQVEIFHCHPVKLWWKLCPMPTCSITNICTSFTSNLVVHCLKHTVWYMHNRYKWKKKKTL